MSSGSILPFDQSSQSIHLEANSQTSSLPNQSDACKTGKLKVKKGEIANQKTRVKKEIQHNTNVQKEETKKEIKKTEVFASDNFLKLEEIYQTQAKLPEKESVDPEKMYPKQTLLEEEPQLMQNARQYVGLEFQFFKSKVASKEYKEIKKKTLALPKGLETDTQRIMTAKIRCALYYAWDDFLGEMTEKHSSSALTFEDLKKIEEEKKQCKEELALLCKKNEKKKIVIHSLTFVKDKMVAINEHLKFSCAADPMTEKKYPKAKDQNYQTWTSHTPRLGKDLKTAIKAKIVAKVEEDLKVKRSEYGPLSLPYQVAFADFNFQLEKLKKNPHEDATVEVLNEICRILDVYCKNEGSLSEDQKMIFFYEIVAYLKDQPKLHDFYKKLNYPESHQFAPLYTFSEEARIKRNILEPLSIQERHIVRDQLLVLLESICDHLKTQVEALKIKEKESLEEVKKTVTESNEQIVKFLTSYLMKLLKIHKHLSYNRFIDLFTVHAFFINRLRFILSKVPEKEIQTARQLVLQTLSPDVTLLETTRHRSTQGRHSPNEKSERKRHTVLKTENMFVRFLTEKDGYDMVSFECAHVVPFPALFARRDTSFEGSRLIRDTKYSSATVTKAYLVADRLGRERMFREDIQTFHQKHKQKIMKYVDRALELLMKLSLEESSHTVHVPSMFNQEVDGASEKYVCLNESADKIEVEALNNKKQKNKSLNNEKKEALQKNGKEDEKEEQKTSSIATREQSIEQPLASYTEKPYKYLLAFNFYRTIEESFTQQHDHIGTDGELDLLDIMHKEARYIEGVKVSIANRMHLLSMQPKTLTNLLMAHALCNVFYGLKNAEAFASEKKRMQQDFVGGEDLILKSFIELEKWMAKDEHPN